jgi:hypothetical protein
MRTIQLLATMFTVSLVIAGCGSPSSSGKLAPNTATSPSITTQPSNQSVMVGQTATFSVTATGTGPLSYQWQKNGAAISGATSTSYTTPATTSADSGSTFRVVVTNSVGNSTSNSATLTVSTAQGQLMALSSNGKYLVNQSTGKPVFIVGDAPQDMAEMLSTAEIDQYLADRESRGFNAIWVMATDNTYQTNPPNNFYGFPPYDGADFTNEDANYWANVDYIVSQASTHNITVFLIPFFVGEGTGLGPGSGGYAGSLLAASDSTVTAFGTWIGDRYKSDNNIVWLLGGDSKPSISGLYAKINVFGTALAAADPNHLIALEACGAGDCATYGMNSVQAFQAAGLAVPSWLTLNWAYPDLDATAGAANAIYNQTPFLPPLCGENFYELEHSITELQVRFEMYTEILSGCYAGRIFGSGAIWGFDSPHGASCCTSGSPTWQSQLSSPGSVAMSWQGKLFSSREHWLLVPDVSHTVVTAGYGSGLTLTTAARTSDGQTIIAYIPNGNATTITVDMAKITSSTGTVQGWWFNPTSAATTSLGTFPNSGTQNFTASNSNDWVLVLDDASARLPAPGSALLASRSPRKVER